MMASKRCGTISFGARTDVPRRVWQHKNNLTPRFASRHHNS
jgi:predicted GIY-YIG superfamily endonuclease